MKKKVYRHSILSAVINKGVCNAPNLSTELLLNAREGKNFALLTPLQKSQWDVKFIQLKTYLSKIMGFSTFKEIYKVTFPEDNIDVTYRKIIT